MSRRVGVQAAKPAKLVRMSGDIRQQFRKPRSGLSVLLPLEFRWRQRSSSRSRLASVLLQLRFVVEGIRSGHCTFHEEKNDAFRFGCEVGMLRQKGLIRDGAQ